MGLPCRLGVNRDLLLEEYNSFEDIYFVFHLENPSFSFGVYVLRTTQAGVRHARIISSVGVVVENDGLG